MGCSLGDYEVTTRSSVIRQLLLSLWINKELKKVGIDGIEVFFTVKQTDQSVTLAWSLCVLVVWILGQSHEMVCYTWSLTFSHPLAGLVLVPRSSAGIWKRPVVLWGGNVRGEQSVGSGLNAGIVVKLLCYVSPLQLKQGLQSPARLAWRVTMPADRTNWPSLVL